MVATTWEGVVARVTPREETAATIRGGRCRRVVTDGALRGLRRLAAAGGSRPGMRPARTRRYSRSRKVRGRNRSCCDPLALVAVTHVTDVIPHSTNTATRLP